MIQQTLTELEARIAQADGVRPESKTELLHLLNTLRTEIAGLAETNREDAQRIADFAQVSTHEAIREKKNPQLMQLSREGLSSSVTEFEQSHPQLVEIVNRICQTLANLGI